MDDRTIGPVAQMAEVLAAAMHQARSTNNVSPSIDDRRITMALEQAAKLDVQAAKAEFYAALNIEVGVGYRSFNIEHFVSTPTLMRWKYLTRGPKDDGRIA